MVSGGIKYQSEGNKPIYSIGGFMYREIKQAKTWTVITAPGEYQKALGQLLAQEELAKSVWIDEANKIDPEAFAKVKHRYEGITGSWVSHTVHNAPAAAQEKIKDGWEQGDTTNPSGRKIDVPLVDNPLVDLKHGSKAPEWTSGMVSDHAEATKVVNAQRESAREAFRKLEEYRLKSCVQEEVKTDPVVNQVVEKYQERSRVGIEKYGTTLEENTDGLLTFLDHLQEEIMDATLYIQKLKNQVENLKKEL